MLVTDLDTSNETEVVLALISVIEDLTERVNLLEDSQKENQTHRLLGAPLDLIDVIRSGQTASNQPSVSQQLAHSEER